MHTLKRTLILPAAGIALLLSSCSDEAVGPADSDPIGEPPALESVSYEALGHGTLAFQRFTTDFSTVWMYVVDADARTTYGIAAYDYFAPVLSPDGTHIAFVRSGPIDPNNIGGGPDIFVADSHGNDVRQLTTLQGGGFSPAWISDGSEIAYFEGVWRGALSGMDVYRQSLSPSVTEGHHVHAYDETCGEPLERMSVSSDNVALFSRIACGGVQEIVALDLDTGVSRQILEVPVRTDEGRVDIRSPAWSPDGTQIAYMERIGTPETAELTRIRIKVMGADGGDGTTVASLDQNGTAYLGDANATVVWSPDGSRIAFVHPVGDRLSHVYIIGADGSDLHKFTTAADVGDVSLSWVP